MAVRERVLKRYRLADCSSRSDGNRFGHSEMQSGNLSAAEGDLAVWRALTAER